MSVLILDTDCGGKITVELMECAVLVVENRELNDCQCGEGERITVALSLHELRALKAMIQGAVEIYEAAEGNS